MPRSYLYSCQRRRQSRALILLCLIITSWTLMHTALEYFKIGCQFGSLIPTSDSQRSITLSREDIGVKALRMYQHMARRRRNALRMKKMIYEPSLVDIKLGKDKHNTTQNVLDCDKLPSAVAGRVNVQIDIDKQLQNESFVNFHGVVHGHWSPSLCIPSHRVAIIIPFRNRETHLAILLVHLIRLLLTQNLEFQIFIAEQSGNTTFNKGRLMNAGFLEAVKRFNPDCVVFHDVDLIPEDERIPYHCHAQPTHLSVAIDEMDYKLRYELLVGGVLSFKKEHFILVNGYSNEYWGWGAEDDDMAYRILLSNLRIMRPPSTIARYKMIPHMKEKPSDWHGRKNLLRNVNKRFLLDGLENVPYTVIDVEYNDLYILFKFDIGEPITKV